MTAILTRAIAGPNKLNYTKSPHYKLFYSCRQDAGQGGPIDRSGQGNNGTLGSTLADATAWATGGQLKTASAGNVTSGVATPVINWQHGAGQSILVCFECKRSAHASEREFFGFRNTGAQSLVVKTEASTGKGLLVLRDPANNVMNKGYTNSAVLWDNTWKMALAWVNGETNRATFRVAGVTQSDLNDEPTGLSSPGTLSVALGLGYIGGAGTYTQDVAFRNLHVLLFDSPPTNIQTIIETLEENPWRPLSAALAP